MTVASPAGEAARERRTVVRRLGGGAARAATRSWPPRSRTRSRCAPSRCWPGSEVLGAVGVSRTEPRAFDAGRDRAAGGARPPGRAGARARAALRPPAPPAGHDRGAGARADAAGGRRHRGRAGRGGAGRQQRVGGAARRGRAHARARARRRATSRATRERFASFSLDAELPLAHAARTVTPLWLESAGGDLRPLPALRRGPPAGAGGGAAAVVGRRARRWARSGSSSTTPHVFRPHDRDYLLALTRLCGQALGRARRYQAEHDLAATLQQALLPEALPRVDGLALAVRYLPAADGTAAGGDFYEAVELGGGRLGIAVGDVVGHGPEAAAAMGQLRSALRAYALEGRPPARVLQLLSRYADGVSGRARGDARLRDRRPRRARAALRVGRASAAAAGHRRGRDAVPGGRARRAAGPLARASSTRTPSPRCPSSRRSSCTPTARSSGAESRSTSAWSGWRARPRPARGWSPTRSATRCWTR